MNAGSWSSSQIWRMKTEGRRGGGEAGLGGGTAGGVGEKDSGGLSVVQGEEPAPPRPREHTRSQTHFTASHSLALISLFISFPSHPTSTHTHTPQTHQLLQLFQKLLPCLLLLYSKRKKKANPLARSLRYQSAIQNRCAKKTPHKTTKKRVHLGMRRRHAEKF